MGGRILTVMLDFAVPEGPVIRSTRLKSLWGPNNLVQDFLPRSRKNDSLQIPLDLLELCFMIDS